MAITSDEWRAEIERVMSPSSDAGMTSREISSALGVSIRTTMEKLRHLDEAGRLGVGRRTIRARDGRRSTSPVYYILPRRSKKSPSSSSA